MQMTITTCINFMKLKNMFQLNIDSQALSGAVHIIISIDKYGKKTTEFTLDITSRQFKTKTYQVKINPEKKTIELDVMILLKVQSHLYKDLFKPW